MPDAPSEPEKYSIDEMMERLKKNSSSSPDEGELVTRPDGSQVMKVRKRKRRSSQPTREKAKRTKKTRIVQISLVMILLFVGILGAGSAIIYSNSSRFRETLVERITVSSGASARLSTFRMNPRSANAGGLALTWPEGNVLDSLTLNGLVAEISPLTFLGKSFHGDEVTAAEGLLTLKVPQAGKPLRQTPAADSDLPIQFRRYRIPALDVSFGSPGSVPLQLSKTEASMTINPTSGHQQLRLYKGALTIRNWPNLKLDRGLIEFSGEESNILGLRVVYDSDERGSMDFTGSVNPYPAGNVSRLDVSLDSFQLAGIVGPSLGRLIDGRVNTRIVPGSNQLKFAVAGASPVLLEVSFEKSAGSALTMMGFPFLNSLSQMLEDEWFKRPDFDDSGTGVALREDNVIKLTALSLEAAGKLAVKGDLSMSPDGSLGGTLEVGLPESIVEKSKNETVGALFDRTEQGYRWVSLTITGTNAAPNDNLKDLLVAAETGTGSENDGNTTNPSFEDLTKPR